jgi:hypothetical protein
MNFSVPNESITNPQIKLPTRNWIILIQTEQTDIISKNKDARR